MNVVLITTAYGVAIMCTRTRSIVAEVASDSEAHDYCTSINAHIA